MRVLAEDDTGAGRQGRQQLLEGGVPAERGELEDPVVGRDREQVLQRGHHSVERAVRHRHRLGPPGGAGGEQHVRRVIERLSVERGEHRVGVTGRVRRVDRAVAAARGPDGQQGHHGVGAVHRRDADHAGPFAQRRRSLAHSPPQLAVRDLDVVAQQGRAVGGRQRVCADRPEQRHPERLTGPASNPLRIRSGLAAWRVRQAVSARRNTLSNCLPRVRAPTTGMRAASTRATIDFGTRCSVTCTSVPSPAGVST